MIININESVLVRFTQDGLRAAAKSEERELLAFKLQPDGRHKLQIHELMNMLGGSGDLIIGSQLIERNEMEIVPDFLDEQIKRARVLSGGEPGK